MPNFDSFDPDGGQSSFFAAPPAQPIPEITADQPQQPMGGGSTYPDIPGATPAPNQMASGYYPNEPEPARSGTPFPKELGQLNEYQDLGGPSRGIGEPSRVVAGMPGYDPATDPQIPPSARAAPEMRGSVTPGPGGQPVYDPGGGPPDPRIQAITQQPLGQGKAIDLSQRGRREPGFTAYGRREQELGPLRKQVEEAVNQPLPRPQDYGAIPPRLPSPEEWRQQHNHGVMQGSGPIFVMAAGALMALAVAFGRGGHASAVPAMRGLAGFVDGLSNSNRTAAAKGLQEYKLGIEEMQRMYENSRQAYRDALEDRRMNIDQKLQALQIAASKYHDMDTYKAAQERRLASIDRAMTAREKNLRDGQAALEKAQKMHQDMLYKQDAAADRKQAEQQKSLKEEDDGFKGGMKQLLDLEKEMKAADPEERQRLWQYYGEVRQEALRHKARADYLRQQMSGGGQAEPEGSAQSPPEGPPSGGVQSLGGGTSSEPQAPQTGDVEDGFRFKGGDPGDKSNWEPADTTGGSF